MNAIFEYLDKTKLYLHRNKKTK